MNFNEYQQEAQKTSTTQDWKESLILSTLGLTGEAGEVTEKVKKIIRDKAYKVNSDDVEEIKKELGDVLWYISQLGVVLNVSLEEIAQTNLQKIQSRQARGKIKGEGDNR